MDNTYTAEQIYNMLMSQDFVDWYEGRFMDHVECEVNAVSKDVIHTDIKNLIRYNQ